MGLDDRARDRQAEPGAPAFERAAPPWKNASKTRSRSAGAIPPPVSATSTSTPPSGLGPTVTLPSGGVWRIAFWIRLKSTRWTFSGLARAGAIPRHVETTSRAGLGLHAHRAHGLPTSSSSRTRSIVHAIAGLQARELEQVVDQRPDRDVRRHAREVEAAGLVVEDVRPHRVDEQRQRRDRRAQVVRDGGDEVAARVLARHELVAHAVGGSGELGELVLARRVALTAAGAPRPGGPARLDVAQDAAGHELRRPHRDGADEQRQHGDHDRVVVGHEHQRRRDRGGDEDLAARRPPPRTRTGVAARRARRRARYVRRGQRDAADGTRSTPVSTPSVAP